jgi:hypothetical protein
MNMSLEGSGSILPEVTVNVPGENKENHENSQGLF